MPSCSALQNHECVSIHGTRIPCCRFKNPDTQYTVKNSSIEEYHNSSFINKVKDEMIDGWHAGCFKCKNEEDAGLTSLRNLYNLDHSFSDSIESIEFSLSNKCNLICRMCDPSYSSKWETFLENNPKLLEFKSSNTNCNSIDDIFYSGRDFSNLKIIKYLGGEPFITPQILKVFEFLDEQDLLKNITFFCSTNGTVFPSKYIDYLKKFKFIRMDLSIDGVGKLNDYIRYGKTWNTVSKVLNQWKEYKLLYKNIDLTIFTTIQAYNAHDINNLQTLSSELDFKFRGALLTSPRYLSINVLPPNYINSIVTPQNKQYFKNYQYHENDLIEFKKFTSTFDSSSNMNLKDVIPNLWKELNND